MNRRFGYSKNECKNERKKEGVKPTHDDTPGFDSGAQNMKTWFSLLMIRKWIGDLAIQKMNVKMREKKKGVKQLPLVLTLEPKIWRPGLTPDDIKMNRKFRNSKNECKMKQTKESNILTTTPLVLTLVHKIWRPGFTPGANNMNRKCCHSKNESKYLTFSSFSKWIETSRNQFYE